MKEYITKDRAKQFVCGHCNEVCSEEPCEPSDCDWMAFIDKEPAADVAPVVQCKDCKHFAPRADKKYGICLVVKGTVPISVPANHWCSFGERCTKRNNHERIHRA